MENEKEINDLIESKIKKYGKLRLHLGCGFEKWDEYINIDLNKEISNPDIISDAASLPFIKDNSVDTIESYHLIEHFGHHKVIKAFIEWKRCLKPGGEIIFETPNLGPVLEEFCKMKANSGEVVGDFGDGSIYETIYGGQKDIGNYHLACFTIGTLMLLLKMAGFKEFNIKREFPKHGIEYGCEWNLRLVATK
jgi:predicted SAM-dependent methyltransferase